MQVRKTLAIAALGLFLGTLVAETAEARAGRSSGGGYRSSGFRGTRTWNNNGFQGINRPRPAANAPTNSWNRGGVPQAGGNWFQRNPFMTSMLGGFAGSALFSTLFGNHGGGMNGGVGGHGGGGGGGFGLLELLLLGGLGYFGYRWWKRSRERAFATPMGGPLQMDPDDRGPMSYSTMDMVANSQTKAQGLAAIALHDSSFTTAGAEDQLSAIFFRVQEAWTSGDRATLAQVCTPEMADTFATDLEAMSRQGERNVLKNIVIKLFDVAEAWTEEEQEYITARIQARLLDYVEKNGQVIEGSNTEPTDFAEVWTFCRPRGGGTWQLSAINQL